MYLHQCYSNFPQVLSYSPPPVDVVPIPYAFRSKGNMGSAVESSIEDTIAGIVIQAS